MNTRACALLMFMFKIKYMKKLEWFIKQMFIVMNLIKLKENKIKIKEDYTD